MFGYCVEEEEILAQYSNVSRTRLIIGLILGCTSEYDGRIFSSDQRVDQNLQILTHLSTTSQLFE